MKQFSTVQVAPAAALIGSTEQGYGATPDVFAGGYSAGTGCAPEAGPRAGSI